MTGIVGDLRVPEGSIKEHSILLMDNSVHMFSGGGQLFVSQLQGLLRDRYLGAVELYNSDLIKEAWINKRVCNSLDRLSDSVVEHFQSSKTAHLISSIIHDFSYLIRLSTISGYLRKGSVYDLIISNDLTDLFILSRRKVSARTLLLILHNPFLSVLLQEGEMPSFSRRILNLKGYLERIVEKHNVVFVCLNSQQRNLLKKRFTSDIYEISNGIDVHKYSPDSTTEREKDLLLYVGRLDEPQKRVSILLDMMNRLGRRKLRLFIVGQGNAMKLYQEYVVSHSLNDRVQFLGYVSETKKIELFRRASLLVSASVNEAMPYTFLEAMACELPIVSYDCSAARMLINDTTNGFIVGDQESFERVVLKLTGDDDLNRKIGENARKSVVESHSLEDMLEQYSKLLDKLLPQSHK